jgi:hypothetical protein
MPYNAALMVWQVTEAAPLGEWVDARTITGALARDGARREMRAWSQSSIDLARGAEVIEVMDTMPAELYDDLFTPPPKAK